MNIALLLSGGTGSRIRSEVPKQYISISGRMIVTYALETLVHSTAIEAIWIVAESEWREAIRKDAEQNGIRTDKLLGFSMPGWNRQTSIIKGLQHIFERINGSVCADKEIEPSNVLIHDAARPLLSEKQIQECFAALRDHDGVMPVLPMKDTVYLSEDGSRVTELLDRTKVYAGQAPELFDLKKYYQANLDLSVEELMRINGSTEPAIMAGMDIVMIPGEESNFKITTETDLERFQKMILQRG